MGKNFHRMLMMSFVFFIITTAPFGTVGALDTTKIGVSQGDVYQGYIVLVHINDSAAQGVFGYSLNGAIQGAETNTKTIKQLNNDTGEVTIHHSAYLGEPSTFDWDGTSKLDSMCSNVIYTDWAYWSDLAESRTGNDLLHVQYFNTEQYFGYIMESNGTNTDANGVVTVTSHRQDCIYNKDTGFMEFIGIYQLEYLDEGVISMSTVEQFIPQNGNQNFNARLYFDLMSNVNPVIDVVIPSKWIPAPTDPNNNIFLNLNYSVWFSFVPILLFVIFQTRFKDKRKGL